MTVAAAPAELVLWATHALTAPANYVCRIVTANLAAQTVAEAPAELAKTDISAKV